MKKPLIPFFILSLSILSTHASAQEFGVTGKINRIFSDETFGGCMVRLDREIGSGCIQNWVSLDCKGETTLPPGTGSRHYATALVAASLGKQVSILLDDTFTVGNTRNSNRFCVAKRFDILF